MILLYYGHMVLYLVEHVNMIDCFMIVYQKINSCNVTLKSSHNIAIHNLSLMAQYI